MWLTSPPSSRRVRVASRTLVTLKQLDHFPLKAKHRRDVPSPPSFDSPPTTSPPSPSPSGPHLVRTTANQSQVTSNRRYARICGTKQPGAKDVHGAAWKCEDVGDLILIKKQKTKQCNYFNNSGVKGPVPRQNVLFSLFFLFLLPSASLPTQGRSDGRCYFCAFLKVIYAANRGQNVLLWYNA